MVRLLQLNTSIFLTYALFLIRRKRSIPFKHNAYSFRLDWIGLHNNQATTGTVM